MPQTRRDHRLTLVMARNHLTRFLGYPTLRDYLVSALALLLYLCACLSYKWTLEGGDLEYLKAKTNTFAVLLIMSVVCALAASMLLRLALLTRNGNLKYVGWVCGFSLLLLTTTSDLGTDLQHHGQFNLIVYFLIWLPVIGCLLVYEGCNTARQKVNNARV